MDDRATHMCFACSPHNPVGLKLVFADDDDRTITTFVPRDEHQGWIDVVHGGIICTVLDEAMAQWCWRRGIMALTAEIKVRMKEKVLVGDRLKVEARMVKARGKLVVLEATASVGGQIRAVAEGKFLMIGDQPFAFADAR